MAQKTYDSSKDYASMDQSVLSWEGLKLQKLTLIRLSQELKTLSDRLSDECQDNQTSRIGSLVAAWKGQEENFLLTPLAEETGKALRKLAAYENRLIKIHHVNWHLIHSVVDPILSPDSPHQRELSLRCLKREAKYYKQQAPVQI